MSLMDPQTLVVDNVINIKVKLLSADAKLPTKETRDIPDAAWDLYSTENTTIPGSGKLAVKTGIALAIPEGWYGNIRNRSGNAIKTPLMVDAGIIDPGYRGEIMVVLVNMNDFPFPITKGQKIAQMLFEPIWNVKFEAVTELPSSDRGEKGFGSTGQ
jgi:dUTP pyrophosphatase